MATLEQLVRWYETYIGKFPVDEDDSSGVMSEWRTFASGCEDGQLKSFLIDYGKRDRRDRLASPRLGEIIRLWEIRHKPTTKRPKIPDEPRESCKNCHKPLLHEWDDLQQRWKPYCDDCQHYEKLIRLQYAGHKLNSLQSQWIQAYKHRVENPPETSDEKLAQLVANFLNHKPAQTPTQKEQNHEKTQKTPPHTNHLEDCPF